MMQGIDSTAELGPNTKRRIRMRAYELYSQRGKIDGHALDDWLQAEEEIVRGVSRHWAWRHDAENNPAGPKR
jgi:Protein of unknown function (DUF2934)